MRSDNSLHATSTPWALCDYAVNRRSELRGNAVGAPGKGNCRHIMENVKLFAIFFSIFVQPHGALRNFKSPCQCCGIAGECDRGFRTRYGVSFVIDILPQFLQWCMQYHVISNSAITVIDCIWTSMSWTASWHDICHLYHLIFHTHQTLIVQVPFMFGHAPTQMQTISMTS